VITPMPPNLMPRQR